MDNGFTDFCHIRESHIGCSSPLAELCSQLRLIRRKGFECRSMFLSHFLSRNNFVKNLKTYMYISALCKRLNTALNNCTYAMEFLSTFS